MGVRLKAKTGTITLFAFDEGHGLSEHAAPSDALLHLLESKFDVMIAGAILAWRRAGHVAASKSTARGRSHPGSRRCSSWSAHNGFAVTFVIGVLARDGYGL